MNARIGSGLGVEDYLSVVAYREGTEAVLTLFEVYTTDAGVQYRSKEIPTRVPLATWAAIELLIQERPNGSAGVAVLTVGTTSAPFTLSSISRSPDFRTDVGISAGSGGTQSAIVYDDVRMDYLP